MWFQAEARRPQEASNRACKTQYPQDSGRETNGTIRAILLEYVLLLKLAMVFIHAAHMQILRVAIAYVIHRMRGYTFQYRTRYV